ncbi:sugar transferase [Cryobacterium tepidiphilum]|uniref:Sugar transferase n=1 Tax=Cryobacterium tepidiphilum TaxID=2486026 RepID=A0A3M8LAX7_9MICO|nr:sugar transferase [Cryobacterium tepidiphilum]RNE62596.1 sugar transferase [Cryobacterium tepidiphilum]
MSGLLRAVARASPYRDLKRDWRDVYAARLAVTDLVVLVAVVLAVQVNWLGLDSRLVGSVVDNGDLVVGYSVVSLIVVAGWMAVLRIYDTRADRVIGLGSQEYKLVVNASVRLFGLLSIAAYLLKVDLARGYILIAFPVGTVCVLLARWFWRQWLSGQRRNGKYSSTVLLVGSEASASHLALELLRAPSAGYRVVGACVPTGMIGGQLPGTEVPVCGSVSNVLEALEATGADTVVVTSSEELSPRRVRELSWSLEPGRQHLVVAPGLTGLGGPRIHTRPVAGLPLIHVETPRYEGSKSVAKRIFDIVVSSVLIVLASPVLALIAITVNLSSDGPILFRQRRVGINGSTFEMLKFRSMDSDAESRLDELQLIQREAGNDVLFKMKDDPRVTGVGRFLRRYSLDELPQLFNVLLGSMSLVGPRPPLEHEVELYETHVHRRFLVKPGITGLWQVSGRSSLSWEDSVRLDLYYVENWSMTGDVVILYRTIRAIVRPTGAY